MSLGELYIELKGRQTSIGSLFGFAALMVAALWNFRLNRRRDAELRADEALSVAAALHGEIFLLRKELGRLARTVANISINAESPEFDIHGTVESHNEKLGAFVAETIVWFKKAYGLGA